MTQCSAKVDHGIWASTPCSRKATVERDGRPLCTTHDPERQKARTAAKCGYHVYGRLCG